MSNNQEELPEFVKHPEATDPDLAFGPKKQEFRKHTDVWALVCFIIFWVLMIILAIMGFVYGDIDYLSLKPAVVDGELGANGETSPQLTQGEDSLFDGEADKAAEAAGQAMIKDLSVTWFVTVLVGVIAGCVGSAIIWLTKKWPREVVWGMIYATISFFALLGLIFICLPYVNSNFSDPDTASSFVLIGIVFLIIAALFACFVWCCKKQIEVSILLIKACCDFISVTPTIFIVPVLCLVGIILFIGFWITVMVYNYSYSLYLSSQGQESEGYIEASSLFQVFMMFWNCEFCTAFSQILIAFAVCTWYFGRNEYHQKDPVSTGFKVIFLFHLGSVCYGSLLIAIVCFIRYIVDSLERQSKKNSGAAMIYCCIKCCLNCIEDILRFISEKAFIMMAISGENFCTSAKQGLSLVWKNLGKVFATSNVTGLYQFFSFIFIVAISVFIGYLTIAYIPFYADQITFTFVPVLVFIIVSIVIASLFMNVIHMGVQTLLFCYCVDKDCNGGTAKSAPEELQHAIDGTHAHHQEEHASSNNQQDSENRQ